jgi:hypothetical protein
VDKKTLEESILYESVKSIAPAIFPSIINDDGNGDKDVIDTIIDEVN